MGTTSSKSTAETFSIYKPPRQWSAWWVGGCIGVFMLLFASAFHATQFAYLVHLEQELNTIASDAAKEASLPKASRTTVEAIAMSHLSRAGIQSNKSVIALQRNDLPVRRWYPQRYGDRFTVTLTVPVEDYLPAPLANWSQIFGPHSISASAEQLMK